MHNPGADKRVVKVCLSYLMCPQRVLWEKSLVWIPIMSATPFPARIRGTRSATVLGTILLVGVGFAASRAVAQSDGVPEAPWQSHPCEGQHVPPPDRPCCSDDACNKDHGQCDGECSVTDWLHWPIFEPCGQISFRGEYLAWLTKTDNLPALVTTNADPATPLNMAGTLPGATVLFGGSEGQDVTRSGGRLTLGYWFSPCRQTGMELTYTFFGNSSSTFSESSTGNPILALPFMDTSATSPGPNRFLLAYPDRQSGSVTITDTQSLDFVEALVRWSICQQCNRRLDFLLGYRFGRFTENLSIADSTTLLGSTVQQDRFI